MNEPSVVKIAMLEDPLPGPLKAFKEFYDSIFKKLNPHYEIHWVDLANDKRKPFNEQGHVLKRLQEEVFDVFVTDLRLGAEDHIDLGLGMIRQVKNAYPELLVIAQSSATIDPVTPTIKAPSFDFWVPKSRMTNVHFRDDCAARLARFFRRNVHIHFDEAGSRFKSPLKQAERNNLIDILRTVTFTSHSAERATAVRRITLTPLTEGRSGSKVYQMDAFTSGAVSGSATTLGAGPAGEAVAPVQDRQEMKCVNTVLKVSKRDKATREIENYNNFVRWYLPYTWRPELIGTAFTKEDGALCYSFLHNDSNVPKNLTQSLKDKELAVVDVAVETIFKPVYQRWYAQSNLIEEKESIDAYYMGKWFEYSDPSNEFRKALGNRPGIDMSGSNYVVIGGVRYEMPRNFLWKARGTYQSCITHGDLNTNNVYVSGPDSVSFIDFQDTGRGHVFLDFLVFETCFRLYYRTDLSFEDLLRLETETTEGGGDALPYSVLARKIRRYAFENFPGESPVNYYCGLSLCFFKLFRFINAERDMHGRPIGPPAWQVDQLLAGILASMKHLEKLESQAVSNPGPGSVENS